MLGHAPPTQDQLDEQIHDITDGQRGHHNPEDTEQIHLATRHMLVKPGHHAHRYRRQHRNQHIPQQALPLAGQILLPLDKKAIDLHFKILDFLLHQR